VASRNSKQARSKCFEVGTFCKVTAKLQTANVAYFQRIIQLSGWLAVPINPDKWGSTGLASLKYNSRADKESETGIKEEKRKTGIKYGRRKTVRK
jgi:hypothetical protein